MSSSWSISAAGCNSLVPAAVTRALLAEDELPKAEEWARRHGWKLHADPEQLRLEVRTVHPADGKPVLIVASFDGYKAVPPTWRLIDPESLETTPSSFPRAGPVNGQASIFHESQRVLCAQWSRLAYGEHSGPHGNWGPETGWLTVRDGNHAETVAEMLSIIRVHLNASPGWMA